MYLGIVKIRIFYFLSLFVFIFSQWSYGQSDFKKKLNKANELFANENFEESLEIYLELSKLRDSTKNHDIDYKIGVCYLNTNINKSKAIPYLLKFKNKNPGHTLVTFLLGRAYQFSGNFDEAIKYFEEYLSKVKADDAIKADEVKLHIQHCTNAKEMTKYPVDVYFFNLGNEINSPYPEYYPFVDEKENFMLFNSKRPKTEYEQKNPNGQFQNGIFLSKVEEGRFTQPRFVGEPLCPSESGNEIIGMNAKGDIVLIMSNDKGKYKLYKSHIDRNGKFSKLEPLPEKINESGDVIAACINNEGNEIYFASDRKGGFGGTDLYVCRKLPNGKWAEVQNLGSEINTPFDEDFPNLSPDGKTLYFSSKGYSSIGGYDIFKATWNEEKKRFMGVKNLGYPINTVYDDMNFRVSYNGKYGYVASFRGDTKGDFDIYRITFNDVEDDYTVIIGYIQSKDNSPIEFKDVIVSVYNSITNELVGTYLPNPVLGRFIMILPPGKYNLECEVPGFKTYKKYIEILDKSSYQKEINTTLVLEK
ncbi:MAG: hypothetical protein N3F09_05120 [Bacteroidia bacterium]|nr:hypothetical protein [Bacteroidia bacterium]